MKKIFKKIKDRFFKSSNGFEVGLDLDLDKEIVKDSIRDGFKFSNLGSKMKASIKRVGIKFNKRF
jgi:hypothetical protein